MAESGEAQELAEVREQVAYLQQVLSAITSQGVDAVVVRDGDTDQIYSLTSADRPYRVLVEGMGEGALTLSESGVVLFANPHLASALGIARDAMVGHDLSEFVAPGQEPVLDVLLSGSGEGTRRTELSLQHADGTVVPFQVAVNDLEVEDVLVRCFLLTDLRAQKRAEQERSAHAAQEAAEAERLSLVREVNDTIVQGLVIAEMALDLDRVAYAREVIAQTSAEARRWIGELVGDQPFEPGTAVRRTPAGRRGES